MLKHPEIIEKLNTLQKTAILTSAFARERFEQAGVPAIGSTDLGAYAKRAGVSYGSAARAWDPELIGRMTGELVLAAGEEGARLFLTPDLKAAIDPYAEGLSEDGYLNGALGAETVHAIHAAGGAAALTRLSLTAEEIAYLDRKEEPSAVYDFVSVPFSKAAEREGCEVVFSDPKHVGTGYYHTNRALFSDVLGGAYGDAFAVGEGDPSADAVKLLRGKISLGGISIPLERALRRYARLAEYEAEGSVHRRDLEEALRDGSAVDGETLDAAVDEIIDFALRLADTQLHAPAAEIEPAPLPVEEKQEEIIAESVPAEEITEPAAPLPVEEKKEETIAENVPTAEVEPEALPVEEKQEEIIAESAPAEEITEPEALPVEEKQEEIIAESVPAAEVEPEALPAEEKQEETIAESVPAAEITEPAAPLPAAEYRPAAMPASPDAARRAAAEDCIVLLKNDGLLPLARRTKIALLGEAYADCSALGARFEIVGRAAGYDRESVRSDEAIPEAVRATGRADAVLVFLYPEASGSMLTLPANRLALLDALRKAKKRVIALVCGDLPVDLKFDAALSATLLVPADGPYAGEALARILSGEVNPSGRLVRTAYDDADAYFRAYRADRDSGRMRVGSFVGYCRYVTEDAKVRYPFGYGIGYSKFTYTDLKFEGDTLSFTLTNIGKYDGSEVVQIYMGAPKTTHVAVKRQLIAFRKVFLRAGERRTVAFDLPAERFSTFDPRLFTGDVEAGMYRVYVGASVLDIRLQCKRLLAGVEREPCTETAADYFPNGDYITVAKVGQEHRVHGEEREGKSKAEKLQLARKAAIYAMPVVGVLAFVVLTVLILSYALDYALLSAAGEEAMKWILYVAAVGVLGVFPLLFGLNRKRVARIRTIALYAFPALFVACFILGAILFSPTGGIGEEIALRVLSCITVGVPILAVVATFVEREMWRTQTGNNHWDKYYFERKRDAQTTSEAEFEDAFRAAEHARAAKAAADAAARSEEPAPQEELVPQFYDRRLTYEQLIADCRTFVAERGIDVSSETLRCYLGALSATPLIFLPAGDGAALCEAVAEYFGKKAYIDNAERYRRYEDLFSQWKQGGRANVPTELSAALVAAKAESAYLHTVLIRHIDPTLPEQLFAPFADVIARRRTALPLPGDENIVLPPNFVIVAELEAARAEVPASLSEVAAVLSPVCGRCEPAPKKTILQAVGFERFSAMKQAVRDDYPLTEACWKNVDLLDGLCRSARIGNKLWLKLELHAAVEAACGGAAEDALDGALAAEVLPWLAAVWKDDVCGKTLAEALTEVFGGEYVRRGLAAIAPAEEAQ